jgi:hypothetical protein
LRAFAPDRKKPTFVGPAEFLDDIPQASQFLRKPQVQVNRLGLCSQPEGEIPLGPVGLRGSVETDGVSATNSNGVRFVAGQGIEESGADEGVDQRDDLGDLDSAPSARTDLFRCQASVRNDDILSHDREPRMPRTKRGSPLNLRF